MRWMLSAALDIRTCSIQQVKFCWTIWQKNSTMRAFLLRMGAMIVRHLEGQCKKKK